MQVEKFLRLQPPTYSGGPNPDTAEHWVHEIERVFATMRCPTADKVVLAAYQLRGFALEWWRLKMQTTFAASRPRIPKASNRYRRVVGGSWDVWRCRIGRGNAVASCNFRGSSRRVRCEPGEFGRFKRVLSWHTVRARRTFLDRRPVQSRAVAVQGRYLQLCSSSSSSVV
ncbi:hypothetical protein Taro_039615 [Colocasia esculenta]|uniref:Retrotransposon gag domain-containing protein n=1 Tax=Colocasia esculenta TaxID=4460 RepID=A0A843W6V4_COLES|nr:hypothetical protein [Colocasia esculenta]